MTVCRESQTVAGLRHHGLAKELDVKSLQKRIPLAKPTLGAAERRAVDDVLQSGWISQGPKAAEFERDLSNFLHTKHSCVVNSGTSAILLALTAAGIGNGDSVIVPSLTCPASVLPAVALNADVQFVDVDISTFNMTWTNLIHGLKSNTVAVLLVHLFGLMADSQSIAKRLATKNIILIEDAALALGARRGSDYAGTVGAAGCYSFHPVKMITTGEGGAVCTNDPLFAAQIESDRSYGAARSAWSRFQDNDGEVGGFARVAYNMKLTDLQAAMGVPQLARLPGFIIERRCIAKRYLDAFADLDFLQLPGYPKNEEEHVFQAFVCLWRPHPVQQLLDNSELFERAVRSVENFRKEVSARGVGISDAAQFLPELPVFRRKSLDEARAKCPNAFLASRLAFALPIFPGMSDDEIDYVIRVVHEAAKATPKG